MVSKIISLHVKSQMSNNHAVQSAPTVPNTLPSGENDISKTSLSCVITCLLSFSSTTSQIVHVVSIDEQHIILG